MTTLVQDVRLATGDWLRGALAGWNRFWFRADDPATLCAIRALAGAMLLYTHAVWSLRLEDFFGPHAWLSVELLDQVQPGPQMWTVFRHLSSPAALWAFHLFALAVFFCLMIGFYSRTASVLAYLLTVCYIHRVPTALFGLDQINTVLAMYLIIGPCGARYSVDSWLRRRRAARQGGAAPIGDAPQWSVSANVALRLLQLHMCVIYFFAATRKLMGGSWWDGSAMWFAFGNLEYQSFDMTWIAAYPAAIAAATHIAILWEIAYAALIWPRATRPVMLVGAVALHLGIVLTLGMPTFGLAMLIGNAAFVPSAWTRRLLERRPLAAAQ